MFYPYEGNLELIPVTMDFTSYPTHSALVHSGGPLVVAEHLREVVVVVFSHAH